MFIELCSKSDFDQILVEIEDFWGSKRTLHLHHPSLIYEFGNTAFVIKSDGCVNAYLFGFFSQKEPVGYVHLLAVRNSCKRLGYAKMLYEHFISVAKENNCKAVKAITSVSNSASVNFHKSLGMELTGNDIIDGVNVIKDYNGPGGHRVVFLKYI